MKPIRDFAAAIALPCAALVFTGCAGTGLTHVPPGESMNVALAKKADLVRLPSATPALTDPTVPNNGPMPAPYAAVEPELPGNSIVERVGEAYSRGEFCLGAGKVDEAIVAFEEAVKIDPAFTEAWHHLAMLYEKKGNSKKAMEAFRRSKKVAHS